MDGRKQTYKGGTLRYPRTRIVLFVLVPALAAMILTIAGTDWILLPAVRDMLMRQKKEALQKLTSSAIGILRHYQDQAKHQVLTVEEAKIKAADEIRSIRYSRDKKNYFWIIDLGAMCIVNPYARHLEGRMIADLKGGHGKKFIQEFVQVARNHGEGFVEYYWQWKDKPGQIEKKLSHLRLFQPWGWIIGTGLYPKDVEKDLDLVSDRMTGLFMDISLFLVLIVILVSGLAVRLERRRQKSLAALDAANRELQKLDKMKDGLIRDVSHELKTPLAKQVMQLEMLRDLAMRLGCNDEGKRLFDVMEGTITRQERIVSNLLELSRLEQGGRKYRKDPVRLDDLVREVIDDYRQALDAHGFSIELALEQVEIIGDKEMLWHVVSNLVNNAIKFRRKDIKPILSIRIKMTNTDYECRTLLSIKDNGIGIEQSETQRVFDKFYQASASMEGTGVGLSICKRIIEDLGGKIWIQSKGKNKGATVIIDLQTCKKPQEI
ncbi:MAG: hypothetical protein GXP49_03980 [Deltaproteobacteria bacterium]|nr:hypothetical protein [Deltaproteobacteria bacterium]